MKRFLYYVYLAVFGIPTMLAVTFTTCVVTIIGTAIFGDGWWSHVPPAIWARLMCLLTLVKVEVRGRENIDRRTSYVFVANHQGAYDIFAIYGWLGHRFKWMMKKSLQRIFLVGYTCQKAGHIFVDRSNAATLRRTIEKAESTLKGGMSLMIFPEGARTFTGKVGPFKKGAYQLALEFKLPLVPITIDGAFKVLPRTARIPRPGKIVLTIHKPIEAPRSENEREAVMDRTRRAIESALPKS